jgi:GDPmannose 4,6-dehydratase
MMQADEPEDYVIATGRTHSVRQFCDMAFAHAGMPLQWRGHGTQQHAVGPDDRVLVRVDPRYFRPADVDMLQGDAGKARRQLGWTPSTSFEVLVRMMVDADMRS